MCRNDTVAYIKILAQDLAGCDLECVVLAMLLDLTVPVNYSGFEYLKAAVVAQYEDPTLDLSNDIYALLAQQYGISSDMVSAAIRSAVKMAWSRAYTEKWHKYFPTAPMDKDGAPTNAEVIAGLARILQLWHGCSAAYLRQRLQEVVRVD